MQKRQRKKRLKLKAWTLTVPMYQLPVRLIVGGDVNGLKVFLDEMHTPGYSIMNNGVVNDEGFSRYNTAGMEFYVEDKGEPTFYAWIEEPRIDTLAHELLHVTFEILDYLGFTPSSDSEEAYTYLFDGLMLNATKILFKVEPKYKM